MGIVRLGERDAARISTEAGERESREPSNNPQRIRPGPIVVGAPAREIVATDAGWQSAADRPGVRGCASSEGESSRGS